MRFPRLAARLHAHLQRTVANQRPPDFIVGADDPNGAYLERWFLTPWRPWQTTMRDRAEASPTWYNRAGARVLGWLPNLYLHKFLRDDDDRALHDHPSWAASFILREGYVEHTIADGGVHQRRFFGPGTLRLLGTRHTHRIECNTAMTFRPELDADGNPTGCLLGKRGAPRPCWTLFLFGPIVREWGFHCPDAGWIHWREFTAAGQPGETGAGCEA